MLAAVPFQNAQMLVMLLCAINGTSSPIELTATDPVISNEISGFTLCRQDLLEIEKRIPFSQIFSGFMQYDSHIQLPPQPICPTQVVDFRSTHPDLTISFLTRPSLNKTAGVIAQDLTPQ